LAQIIQFPKRLAEKMAKKLMIFVKIVEHFELPTCEKLCIAIPTIGYYYKYTIKGVLCILISQTFENLKN
jgi:hypothetical protein